MLLWRLVISTTILLRVTALFLMIGAGRNMAALNRALASRDWNLPVGYSVFGARVCIVGSEGAVGS